MRLVLNSIKFYLLWALIHFVATNLYQHYCAGRSIMGFVASSLNTQMPHCKAMSWIQTISIKTLDSYWALLVTYVVGHVTGILGGVN